KLAEDKARRDSEAAEAEARAKAAEPKVGPKPGDSKIPDAGAQTQIAKAQPDHDVAVIRPFPQARGSMTFPVAGAVTGKYGEGGTNADDASVRAKGITITARPGAAVVAPYDGIVAFAGPFRGYGQLLIIEHSEGY